MNIKIHRGLNQIGGCITEISTATSRIFVDLGQNLPGVGEPTTEEEDQKLVDELFANNRKEHEAVIYTHAHEDHVGLFHHVPANIPQYIGEGGKEILIAKYEGIIKIDAQTSRMLDLGTLRNPIPELIKEANEKRKQLSLTRQKLNILRSFITWQRTKPHAAPKSFKVGDIKITPFFNCHSIYDSYMFLIEADGKRIWHTGDYREHGYMGKGLFPTLKRYATDIDVLITEGTMLNQDIECPHEREISRKMACVMEAFKYVVVLASATDIERLAAIKEATKKVHKSMYICSGFMQKTMQIFTRREAELSNGLFEFHPHLATLNDAKIKALKQKGFVLIAGPSQQPFVESLCYNFDPSEVLLIYSSWDGYYLNSATL